MRLVSCNSLPKTVVVLPTESEPILSLYLHCSPFKRSLLSCYDVNFNIQRAAELFSSLISSNGGNVLLAIGSYNGWYSGLTYAAGTAAASQGQCHAQNNLDYIHQFCNGWMQNKSGYTLGTYCEYSFPPLFAVGHH